MSYTHSDSTFEADKAIDDLEERVKFSLKLVDGMVRLNVLKVILGYLRSTYP